MIAYNYTVNGQPAVVSGTIYQYPNSSTSQVGIQIIGQSGDPIPSTTYTDNTAGLEYTISSTPGSNGGIQCVITDAPAPGQDYKNVQFIGSQYLGTNLVDAWVLGDESSGQMVIFQDSFNKYDRMIVTNYSQSTNSGMVYFFSEFSPTADPNFNGVPASIAPLCKKVDSIESVHPIARHSIMHARAHRRHCMAKRALGRRVRRMHRHSRHHMHD